MTKPPIQQVPGKKDQVRNMFNNIAGSYDFLNHFLSMGIDHLWRRRLVRAMTAAKPATILDLATGTADLAISAARIIPCHITGTDISAGMLEVGKNKVSKSGLADRIELIQADSENLPFDDHSFDCAMVAYGVRNYENLPAGLKEMFRVLKPGGSAYILEFSKPTRFPVKQLYHFYFTYILPLLGRMVSRHSSAYTYLPESVSVFPQGPEFTALLEEAGFNNVSFQPLTMGITTLYRGTKNLH